MAHQLLHKCKEGHTTVGILGDNSVEWYFSAMGIIFSSLIAFGIYPSSLPNAIATILNHSKAPILFVDTISQEEKVLEVVKDLEYLRYTVRWGGKFFLFLW